MSSAPARREVSSAVGLCLAGAALILIAAGRVWVVVQVAGRAPLPDATVRLTGADLAPGARPLALVGLAGVVALLATRRAGRVVVGLLLLAAGVGVIAVTAGVASDLAQAVATAELPNGPRTVSGTPAPVLCLLGGGVLALAGLLVVLRGRRWSALSSRYDGPAVRAGADGPAGSGVPVASTRPVGSGGLAASTRPVGSGGLAASTGPVGSGGPDFDGPHPSARTDAAVPPSRDGQAPVPAPSDLATWDALDRGEDPTQGAGDGRRV